MGRIDDLIRGLCPEGVRMAPLGEFLQIVRGERVTKRDLIDEGFPVVSGGVGYMGYVARSNREADTITMAQYGAAGYVKWQTEKFWANDVCFSLVLTKTQLDYRYLYFFLKDKQELLYRLSNRNAIPYSIEAKRVLDLRIPVPPLEVQREIVSILDKFTQLEAELEAELEARRVQYEETRNNLLNFDQDLSSHPLSEMCQELCPEGVPTRLVGDLFAYEQPTRYLVDSADYVGSGTPVLTAGQTFVLGHTLEEHGIYPATPESPVIIFDDFTTGFQWVDFPFKAKSSAMKMISPRSGERVELRFLYHWMGVRNFQPGEHARHWISVYSQFEIPTPPLEVQREIVSILDKLHALVNDITFGLPAEIAARRKQYEHYRNKLLTFKELEAA